MNYLIKFKTKETDTGSRYWHTTDVKEGIKWIMVHFPNACRFKVFEESETVKIKETITYSVIETPHAVDCK